MPSYYAGIGSRKTPPVMLTLMTRIAECKRMCGYTLRSGGAIGADRAFEAGAGDNKTIFFAKDATQAALDLTAKFHPAWHKCSILAKHLHARNALIVLGPMLDTPVDMVICYTERGLGGGGTGQAMRIAQAYGIKVRDLGLSTWFKHYDDFVDGFEYK